MTRVYASLLCLTLVACSQADAAQQVNSIRYPRLGVNQFVGRPYYGHDMQVRTDITRPRPLLKFLGAYNATTNPPMVLEWGRLNTVTCTGKVTLCLTQTSTLTQYFGDYGGQVVDRNVDSDLDVGACFRVEAGGKQDFEIDRRSFYSESAGVYTADGVLSRSGACTDGRPCRVDGDCVSGTCTANVIESITGAYLTGIASSATNCFVWSER